MSGLKAPTWEENFLSSAQTLSMGEKAVSPGDVLPARGRHVREIGELSVAGAWGPCREGWCQIGKVLQDTSALRLHRKQWESMRKRVTPPGCRWE